MSERKRVAINRGFVLGYAAIAILALLTGFITNYNSSLEINADTVGEGSSCLTKSTVKSVAVTTAEQEIFGDNVVAYSIVTAQNKNLKLLVGSEEQSAVGDGGIITITAGIQNLDTAKYTDKSGKIVLNYTDGNKNKSLTYSYGNPNLATGQYWYKASQATISDYGISIKAELRNGSDNHLQACVADAVPLSATLGATATTTATSSSTSAYIGEGSSCLTGTSVASIAVTSAEKALFGDNVVAYRVQTNQSPAKNLKLLVGVKESSAVGDGGTVTFTAGLQNLDEKKYDEKKGRIYLRYTDGKNSKYMEFYFGDGNLDLGQYWYKSVQTSMSDYGSSMTMELKTGSDNHLVACIANAIDVDEAVAEDGSTSDDDTTSSTTYSILNGYNAISTDTPVSTEAFLDAGMTVFDYNWNGDKKWRSTSNGDEIDVMYPGLGYYVYNDGSDTEITVSEVSSTSDVYVAKKGWNLLHAESGGTLDQININVLDSGESVSCHSSSCVNQMTLKELFEGTSSTRKAYSKIFLIVDGNSSDADTAFEVTEVTEDNIDTVQIPSGSTYWVYLFDL